MNRVLIFLLLISTGCYSQTTVRGLFRVVGATVTPPPTPPPTTTGDSIMVTVTFASAPTAPTSNLAELKYNKYATFQFEGDDLWLNASYDAYIYMQGGTTTTGTTYPNGHTFTDGAGNNVKWRGGVAINTKNNFNNSELWGSANRYTAAQLAMLVQNDWTLSNHGYYHDIAKTNVNYPPDSPTFSQAGWDLAKNDSIIYARMSALGVPFRNRTVITPAAWDGFARAADSLNYLVSTSTGVRDNYFGYPQYLGLNVNTNGANFLNEETLPTTTTKFGRNNGFVHLLRLFQDDYSTANVNTIIAQLTDMLDKASPTKHLTTRLGTHGTQWPNIVPIFDYIDQNGNDRVWVTSLHEWAEYREVKRLVQKTQTVSGNTLTIKLAMGQIPSENRFRDMSLLITGGTITNVSVVGADSFSYNSSTGLVNIFKKKTTGFTAPLP